MNLVQTTHIFGQFVPGVEATGSIAAVIPKAFAGSNSKGAHSLSLKAVILGSRLLFYQPMFALQIWPKGIVNHTDIPKF